jgi:hypothetical protein
MLVEVVIEAGEESSRPNQASARCAEPGETSSQHLQLHPRSASCPIPPSISPLPTMSAARAFSTALRAGAPRAPIAARFAATRGYAAAASPATGAANKPPVALYGVDGTYANALVRLPQLQLASWR